MLENKSPEQFAFTHRLRVRWSEVDMQAIVFNGHYLTYFDVAFTEYWRALGLPSFILQAEQGQEMFARKSGIEYHAPARFDDELEIGVRCVKLGTSSIRFEVEIWRTSPAPHQHLISGELIYVYADTTLRKPVPLPAAWRERIASFEKTPPQQG